MDEDSAVVVFRSCLPAPFEAEGIIFKRVLGTDIPDGCAGGGKDAVF